MNADRAVEGPRAGDLTVCFYCGSTFAFADDLTLRAIEPGEIGALPEETRVLLLRISNAAAALRRRRRPRG